MKTLVVAIVVLIFNALAWANGHDHVHSLPKAASFAKSGHEIFFLPHRSLVLKRFFQGNREDEPVAVSRLRRYMRSVMGVSEEAITKFVAEAPIQRSLRELAAVVDTAHPENGLKRMLGFQHPGNQAARLSSDEKKEMYILIENIRRLVLLSVSLETFGHIFRDFFRSETHANRADLDLSVPVYFYEGENWKKLELLQNINASIKPPSKMRFFLSIPRRTWFTDPTHALQILAGFQPRGLIHGIDLTGSMLEFEQQDGDPEHVAQRLMDLFQLCHDRRLALRLHAFESSTLGAFYEGLKLALNRLARHRRAFNFELRIGHIACLTEKWVERFAELRDQQLGTQITFECNPASNQFLHATDQCDTVYLLEYLRKRNFGYILGSDGRGMLRASSVVCQMNRVVDADQAMADRWERVCAELIAEESAEAEGVVSDWDEEVRPPTIHLGVWPPRPRSRR